MSRAAAFQAQGNEVWLLANATAYEAREVASEFESHATRWKDLLRAIAFALFVAWYVRPTLHRLMTRQAKLIASLKAAPNGSWPYEHCSEMAQLLSELITDERRFISRASAYFRPVLPFVMRHLGTLSEQVRQLEEINLRLEALSVRESPMPGDADYSAFMFELNAPEEYDFSVESDLRKVHSHT